MDTFWGCFVASDTEDLESVHGTIKCPDHEGILELNVLPSVKKLMRPSISENKPKVAFDKP